MIEKLLQQGIDAYRRDFEDMEGVQTVYRHDMAQLLGIQQRYLVADGNQDDLKSDIMRLDTLVREYFRPVIKALCEGKT